MTKIYKLFWMLVFAVAFGQMAQAQVTVTGAHTSSNGSYSTVKLAFDAINLYDQTGFNILVAISDNTTETGLAVLNAGAWATLTVYPTASGKTISGTLRWPLIKLNGADNVTIDGSYNGNTQSLTFSNNSLSSDNNTIALSNSANNNTIKNCRIYSKYRCITTTDADNTLIEGNEIFGDALGSTLTTQSGIYLMSSTTNTKIRRNNIHDFYTLVSKGFNWGIYYNSSTTTETEISNNVIYAIKGMGRTASPGFQLSGICINAPGNVKIFNNTIYLTGNLLGNLTARSWSSCIWVIGTTTSIDIRNNILYNAMGKNMNCTATGNETFQIYSDAPKTALTNINANDYFYTDQDSVNEYVGYLGGNITNLDDWKAATEQDVGSYFTDPHFTSATNLKPIAGNFLDGENIAAITNDYEGIMRNNPPHIGAYEGTFDLTWTGNTDSDWNTAGNWNPELIPAPNANIAIPAEPGRQPVINQAPASPAVCNTLTIASGAELLIAPGKALTVYGTLTKSANPAELVIESGGSLMHNSNDVAATVKLQITGSSTLTLNKYHFVAIPLTAASLPTSSLFADSYVYRLDAKKVNPVNENHYGLWVGLGTSPNTALGVDTGYMIYYPGDSKEYAFAGNLNNGSFNAAVLGHDGANTFNLVPNPYPSSINWQAATGWTKTNIENKFWILNNGVYTSFIGGASPDSANGGRRFIVPGQAFVVHATAAAPALRMTNEVRVHSSAGFLKSGGEYPDRLSIIATCNSMSDEIVVKMAETATMDYDAGFDVIKLPGSADAPNLSTLAGDQQLCINALPLLTGQTIVPMNFETQFTGQVSFTIGGIGSFDPSINIYLKDELTNQTINLRNQQVYTFVHNTANAANRFKLVFGGTIGISETPADAYKMWIAGNTVYINAPELNGQQALVEVFNPAGQRLLAKSLVLDDFTTLELNLKGFVIVKLTSGQKVITTKGILMK